MRKRMILAGFAVALTAALAGCQTGNQETGQAAETTPAPASAVSTPWVGTKNTTRINTSDPIQAAVVVSRTLWTAVSDSNRPASVVLTDVKNWQIAAASTDLIHHPSNGPVLFMENDAVPQATLEELKRLRPLGAEGNHGVQIVIVGPVSDAAMKQLDALNMKIDKIEGDEPAAVAQAIDSYYAKAAGELPQAVVIGSMDNPEYTLPAVNWIAHMPEPLLYVTKDEIPEPTVQALNERGGNAVIYLLGPESAVSSGVEEKLKSYGSVTRISGENPAENAIAFAKFKDDATGFGWGIITPGHNLSFLPADSTLLAVAAAPFSHLGKHAPLIFTNKDGIPDAVMDYTAQIQPKFQESPAEGPYNHAWITGDAQAITAAAQSEIDDMLEISPASGGNPHSGH
ncbi:cell wall-binding repeat-containing protein [Paenibacillus sp. CN-4]|uniref:cell wall-binding repeat-containing protein n=1 Tax=Paenibacillus nanchangensis TaxID=3348343 RepID=UPI00397E3EC8